MPLEKDWLDSTAYEYFKQQNPPKGGFKSYHVRTHEELVSDVTGAYDRLKKLVGANDVLRKKISDDDKRFKFWRNLLGSAISGTYVFLGWLIVHLLPYVLKGMAK